MFCDMVGSSALSTRLDPEEQRNVIIAFHTCCANEVKSFDDMTAQYLGDAVLPYLGYPTAHENDAERAILAGLAILRAVRDLKSAGGEALQTRIAVGSGMVVVGDLIRQSITQENAAIGEATNLVSRLLGIAAPNSIVISPSPIACVAPAETALQRISIQQDTLDRINELVSPGSSLIITDEAMSQETCRDADFIVLLSGELQGGIKIRKRNPYSGYDESHRPWPANGKRTYSWW